MYMCIHIYNVSVCHLASVYYYSYYYAVLGTPVPRFTPLEIMDLVGTFLIAPQLVACLRLSLTLLFRMIVIIVLITIAKKIF